jgi:hypothetical protein
VRSLRGRVEAAAREALAEQRYVSAVDVLAAIGWIHPVNVERWRSGRLSALDVVMEVGPQRIAEAADALRAWALGEGLEPAEVTYVAGTPDRRELRFTASGSPELERSLRVHWSARGVEPVAQERVVEGASAAPELVVFMPVTEFICSDCGGTDSFLVKDGERALCLACADLDHLVFLGAGDGALTRRSRKASALSAVVVRFSRARKRYERQGVLVEPAALETAELQCLGDEEARARRRERDRERRAQQDENLVERMAVEIRRLFPGCPATRAEAIATHAAVRGSGRVGRSAAGRALDPDALTLAVVASVRHDDTGYDGLLMAGVPRIDARARVQADIERVLDGWRTPT